jgi:predicted kinase
VAPAANGGALVALCGLPGTGKSHFAAALAAHIPCLALGSDRLRKILVPEPRYTREEHARVFRAAHALLESLLAQGHRVVFDATNLTERAREPLGEIAARVGVPLLLVQFHAPPTLVRQRLARRSRGEINDTWSDADWRIYCRLYPGQEPVTGPHIFVDSSRSIEPALREVARLLEGGATVRPD